MLRKSGTVFLALLALLPLALGCSYNVSIMSQPEGAGCYIQGMYVGETPVNFQARSGTPKTLMIKITKPGYKEINSVIESSYKADISLLWLIPGLIPYFVGTATLEDHYNFVLEKR